LSILLHLLTNPPDPSAHNLARKLDSLPLALATAGVYLHQVSTSFADYLRLYETSWLQLQRKTPGILSYKDRALYSIWNISLEHVKQQSELAAKLLQLWAYFDVWLELLQAGRGASPEWFSELTEDQLSFEEAVRVLCEHALVEADSIHVDKRVNKSVDKSTDKSMESLGYSIHSCVHSWTVHVVNKGWDEAMSRLALRIRVTLDQSLRGKTLFHLDFFRLDLFV
jgi:hypothetical protein